MVDNALGSIMNNHHVTARRDGSYSPKDIAKCNFKNFHFSTRLTERQTVGLSSCHASVLCYRQECGLEVLQCKLMAA